MFSREQGRCTPHASTLEILYKGFKPALLAELSLAEFDETSSRIVYCLREEACGQGIQGSSDWQTELHEAETLRLTGRRELNSANVASAQKQIFLPFKSQDETTIPADALIIAFVRSGKQRI